MFQNRKEAGVRLADALDAYKDKAPLVLAIPRGGVEVGFQVARRLNTGIAILVVRKLPLPRDPEAGFGAIAEDGSTFMAEHMAAALPPETVATIVRQQKEEIQRRIAVLRQNRPFPSIAGRTVILVDDGVAVGSTMRAAIAMCRNKEAEKVVVAAPVASLSTARKLASLAEDVVIIEKPPFFRAVAQVYHHWYDVGDEEVVAIMQQVSHHKT